MSKKKKLFVVSDIHGYGSVLKKALDEAGFDAKNEDHIFVCCGDLFDRGCENKMVYDFVKSLERKVLICGNHDERLAEILTEKRANLCDVHNGTDVTIDEFFGAGSMGEYGELRLSGKEDIIKDLLELIDETVDFYETENYVFVHGWIPVIPGTDPPEINKDWRNADAKAWHSARFLEWHRFFGENDVLPDKTIVCGHRPTRLAYTFDPDRTLGDASIYYGERMIAIDAGTSSSGRINVLVLEENLIDQSNGGKTKNDT